jgi:hypothetical protein
MSNQPLECTSNPDDEPRKPLHVEPKSSIDTRHLINKIIDHNATIATMSLVTVYALYGDDVRKLAFPPSADVVFLILTAMAFVCFALEITLLCWCRENYLRMPNFEAAIKMLREWSVRSSAGVWFSEFGKTLQVGSFYFWLDLISTLSMAFEVCAIDVSMC